MSRHNAVRIVVVFVMVVALFAGTVYVASLVGKETGDKAAVIATVLGIVSSAAVTLYVIGNRYIKRGDTDVSDSSSVE